MRAMRFNGMVGGLCGLVMAILVLPAIAQETPDYKTVVKDYVEATGGEMAHKGIESIKARGTVSLAEAGIEGEMSITQADGKGVMKMTLAGLGSQSMGYDGETAWSISEMTGPEILEGEQKDQFVMQMNLSPVMNIDQLFKTVECTGTEEFNGEECYVLKCENDGQEPVYQYFSVESKLQTGNKMTAASPMGSMEIISSLSDYRDVNGVKMPFKTAADLPQGMVLETVMDSIEANTDISDKAFELPEEVKELKEDG